MTTTTKKTTPKPVLVDTSDFEFHENGYYSKLEMTTSLPWILAMNVRNILGLRRKLEWSNDGSIIYCGEAVIIHTRDGGITDTLEYYCDSRKDLEYGRCQVFDGEEFEERTISLDFNYDDENERLPIEDIIECETEEYITKTNEEIIKFCKAVKKHKAWLAKKIKNYKFEDGYNTGLMQSAFADD